MRSFADRLRQKLIGEKPQTGPAADGPEELDYWTRRLADLMQSRFGLALDPIQTDLRSVPSVKDIGKIQDTRKADPATFIASGCRSMCFYLEELVDNDVDPTGFERILEFGMGLGRLIRHFFPFRARLHGCDVTREVLEYTRSSIGHRVECVLSGAYPPLTYDDGYFDFVYANSVFTHIQMPLARNWIEEIARIVKPGGIAIISVFDAKQYLGHLTNREYDRIERGDGYCEWGDPSVLESFAFLTPKRLRSEWGRAFEVLELREHFRDQSHLVMRRSVSDAWPRA